MCPLFLVAATTARAYEVNDQLEVYGYMQGWATAYEQMQAERGLVQQPSGDHASGRTTGFSLNRARLGANLQALDDLVTLSVQLKLENPVEILDIFVRLKPIEGLSLQFGQFKIPSTWENLTEDRNLDFILRTDISDALIDYSLSRTTYSSSLFWGNNAYLRDFGLGLKLDVAPFDRPVRLFGMVSNGLGANLFIGGATKEQYVITNRAQFCYAARLELEPVRDWLTLGGVASTNRHDNIVFHSGHTVLDLNRRSASGDLQVKLVGTGVRLAGLYGGGKILDDWDNNGRIDFKYSGWETRLIWELNPLFRALWPNAVWDHHKIELGGRFEDYVTETDESHEPTHRRTWTVGVAYGFDELLKLQLNGMLHRTAEPYQPDLKDDAIILSVQAAI